MGSVLSVNAGEVCAVPWGDLKRSAIDKRPVEGAVRVGKLGLVVDKQADLRHHGGLEQAVYAYAREDLDWWAGHLGRALRNGQFGENLTTVGVDVNKAVIGERWRIGSVLLELNAPRIPCSVFAGFIDEDKWVTRFTARGRVGAYFRVIEEGELRAGDRIEVEQRPDHGVRLEHVFRGLTGHREYLPSLLIAPQVQDKVRAYALRILSNPDECDSEAVEDTP